MRRPSVASRGVRGGGTSAGESDDELNFQPEEVRHRRDPNYRFQVDKELQQMRLQLTLEDIIQKYSEDFSNIGDEIDLLRNEIVVDRGHIRSMRNEKDRGPSASKHPVAGGDDDEDRLLQGTGGPTRPAATSSTALVARPMVANAARSSTSLLSRLGGNQKLSRLGIDACSTPLAFDAPGLWDRCAVPDPLWRTPELPIAIPTFRSSFAANLFADKYQIPTRHHTKSLWAPGGDNHDDDDATDEIERLKSRPRFLPPNRSALPRPRTRKRLGPPRSSLADEEDSLLLGPQTIPHASASKMNTAVVKSLRSTTRRQPNAAPAKATSSDSRPRSKSSRKRPGAQETHSHLPSAQSSTASPNRRNAGALVVGGRISPSKVSEKTHVVSEEDVRDPSYTAGISQTLFVDIPSSHLINDSSYVLIPEDSGFPTPPASDTESSVIAAREKQSKPSPALQPSSTQNHAVGSSEVASLESTVEPSNGLDSMEGKSQGTQTAGLASHEIDLDYLFSDEERGYTRKRKRVLSDLTEESSAVTKVVVQAGGHRHGKRARKVKTTITIVVEEDQGVEQEAAQPPLESSPDAVQAGVTSSTASSREPLVIEDGGPTDSASPPMQMDDDIQMDDDVQMGGHVQLHQDIPLAISETSENQATPTPASFHSVAEPRPSSEATPSRTRHDRPTPATPSPLVETPKPPSTAAAIRQTTIASHGARSTRNETRQATRPANGAQAGGRSSGSSVPQTPTGRRTGSTLSTPRSARTLSSLVSEDELALTRPRVARKRFKPDFFARTLMAAEKAAVPGGKTTKPSASARHRASYPFSRPTRPVSRSFLTPVKISSRKELFFSPGGTLRVCGQNGINCGGDFCMTCFGVGDD